MKKVLAVIKNALMLSALVIIVTAIAAMAWDNQRPEKASQSILTETERYAVEALIERFRPPLATAYDTTLEERQRIMRSPCVALRRVAAGHELLELDAEMLHEHFDISKNALALEVHNLEIETANLLFETIRTLPPLQCTVRGRKFNANDPVVLEAILRVFKARHDISWGDLKFNEADLRERVQDSLCRVATRGGKTSIMNWEVR